MDEIDKVVLVTGGASGLGRTIVEQFLRNNHKVIFTYLKSEDKAKELVEQFQGCALGIKADATNYKEAQDVVEIGIQTFGKIDILVNNVAAARDKAVGNVSYNEWDYTIKNTLYSCFNYTNVVAKHFIERKEGKIISIGSINGLRGREGSAGYSAAKAAIVGYMKTVAKELGGYGITANVVAPGFVNTDGQANTSQLIKKMVLDECAIRKLTEPIEVANLVLFLASNQADNITGQVYQIDCGQYI